MKRVIVVIGVVVLLSGCGKVRLNSSTMCAAHGGTFDATAKSCTYKPTTITAKQSCEAHHGAYDMAADICEFNP